MNERDTGGKLCLLAKFMRLKGTRRRFLCR